MIRKNLKLLLHIRFLRILLVSVFFLFVLVITSIPSYPRTWYIKADGSGDAPTIQAGIDSSAAGDTVLVASGTYADTTQIDFNSYIVGVNIKLNKNVNLIGEDPQNKPIIDGTTTLFSFFIEDIDSPIIIQGFDIYSNRFHNGCLITRNYISTSRYPETYTNIRCSNSSLLISMRQKSGDLEGLSRPCEAVTVPTVA